MSRWYAVTALTGIALVSGMMSTIGAVASVSGREGTVEGPTDTARRSVNGQVNG
ncbi:hypothetical protein OH768_27020 [Streptomyces sp. NBC_01622]|uniref:hypothetical protein n=1 Tax=Streptomyces sp. NBC_01622 TaxID=2975903 RepID=UPI0038641C66|nr:hypothetical protein OH768_27020 [Streptomyces sp. NBC_01622]